jgi:hypothetical protein
MKSSWEFKKKVELTKHELELLVYPSEVLDSRCSLGNYLNKLLSIYH